MKKVLVLMVMMLFSTTTAKAVENVLQGIQIDALKDTYSITLQADEAVEIKKTIQSPNKMFLNLEGIRASKTINTVYKNAVDVDSVLVDPTSDESLRIFIQADNVENAQIEFETLKTPLGILPKSQPSTSNQLVLNNPMETYKPIYASDETSVNEADTLSVSGFLSTVKRIFKNDKINQIVTTGLITVLIFACIKLFKKEEKEVKIGLSSSLKDREINLYKDLASTLREGVGGPMANMNSQIQAPTLNYGLKSYQNTSKSPYATPENPRFAKQTTPIAKPAASTITEVAATQRPIKTVYSASRFDNLATTKPINKTCNVDSMKFLESMTKIYEKNGRADLAQGLKANMGKAKARA